MASPTRCGTNGILSFSLRAMAGLGLALGGPAAWAAPDPVATLNGFVAQYGVYGNTNAYTPTIFTMDALSTACPISVANSYPPLAQRWSNIFSPCNLVASAGTDGEALIYDGLNGKTYEFWQLKNSSGKWSAVWGGGDSDANFYVDAATQNRVWARPNNVNFGVQASGIAFTPGMITTEDLANGYIDHAVQISVTYSCATWKGIATRTDGNASSNPQDNCIEYGQVYKLPSTVDISSLKGVPRMIALAAQQYGLIVTDQTHGAVVFRFENYKRTMPPWPTDDAHPITDPYRGVPGRDGPTNLPDYFGCDGLQGGAPVAYGKEYDCAFDQNNLMRPWNTLGLWSKLVAVN